MGLFRKAVFGGIIGIIALGGTAGVWFLMRDAGGAPAVLPICFITPLLSAAAAFFAASALRRPHELKETPIDLHGLFTDCRALIAPKAAEKGLMLHFYAEPAISKIPLGDPERLRQALTALMANAVKYTNTGIVKLYSAVKTVRKNNITLSFEVKDSGNGITGDTRDVKELVEIMGGKLLVEKVPGIGSKFCFDLTFKTQNAPESDAPASLDIPDEFEKPMFEGEVLLCEDNYINQQIIGEQLARVGLKTIVAENGKVGVEIVQRRLITGKKPFGLIFMDIHMPVMDGLEAAAKILALNTGIPIVAITANIMPNDLEIYRMNGMYDCVGKPFSTQELWRCLGKYFKSIKRI